MTVLSMLTQRGLTPPQVFGTGCEDWSRGNSAAGIRVSQDTARTLVALWACQRLLAVHEPFNVDARVYDPYLAPEVPDAYDFKWSDSLERVFEDSEVVVCLAPLTPRTKGMIGAAQLDRLQPNAAFVNVSRGPIVDSAALIERLKRGDGVRAALDVFDPEPIPTDGPLSEIRRLPNVFLSPHLAGVTAASRPRFFELMVDELERFFGGYRPRYVLGGRSLQNRRGD
jgi:phosphoglycerate dehydrogenase-like enzyme